MQAGIKLAILMTILAAFTCACAGTPRTFTLPNVTATPGSESSAGTTVISQGTSVAGPFPTSNQSTSLPTTPVVVTPDGPETPFSSPTPDVGFPAQPQPGQVTIALSMEAFAVGQPIEATVLNGLAESIYTADMKTDCSILTLERLENSAWQAITECNLMRAPQVVEIGAQRGKIVLIDPLSANFGLDTNASTPAFGVGTYHLKFTYRLTAEPEGEEGLAASSESFVIQ